jgi:hypothetical protein
MTGRCPMSAEPEAFGTKASRKLNKKLTCNVKLVALARHSLDSPVGRARF